MQQKSRNRRKAFILDFDGVLVNSEPIHMRTIRTVLKPFGVDFTTADYKRRFVGTGSRHIIGTLLREHNVRTDLNALVLERKNLYQQSVKHKGVKTIAGVKAFIREMRKRKIPIVVATGGHRDNVIASLKSARLPMNLKIIDVSKVPARKPHPQIFIAAARAVGAKPKDCVVFEDAAVGVVAAKRARMKCVGLTTTITRSELKKAGANLVVRDFRDKKILRFLGL